MGYLFASLIAMASMSVAGWTVAVFSFVQSVGFDADITKLSVVMLMLTVFAVMAAAFSACLANEEKDR